MAGLLLLLSGCELQNSFSTLATELVNPDAETVDGEGHRIITGSYSDLRFDGNNADGSFVLGIEDHDQLVIVDFESGEKCAAGPAAGSGQRYTVAVSRADHEEERGEALVPFLSTKTDEQPEQLRFTNFECDVSELSVDFADLPILFDEGYGFLVQTDQAELYVVNPWTGKKQLLAEDAAVVRNGKRAIFAEGDGGDWMWTIEAREVVARDDRLKEVGRVGSDVSRLTHSSSGEGGPMIAYREDRTVYLAYANDLSNPQLLSEDACGETFHSGANGREVLYYSPCDERALKVKELETGVVREIATGVQNYRIAASRSTGPVIEYLTSITKDSGERDDVGELWAKFGEEPAVKLGDNGNVRLSRLSGSGKVRAIVDWQDGGGTFTRGQLGEELQDVASGVAYFNSLGLITDFDGKTGKLQQFDDQDNLQLVADNVSILGIRYESPKERALVITDYDGHQGSLTLVQSGKPSWVGDNVRPSSYQFTVQLPMVTLLSDWESEHGTATLKLKFIESDETLVISDGVSESVEVSWPLPGFLYSVPHGERAGIWFSRTL